MTDSILLDVERYRRQITERVRRNIDVVVIDTDIASQHGKHSIEFTSEATKFPRFRHDYSVVEGVGQASKNLNYLSSRPLSYLRSAGNAREKIKNKSGSLRKAHISVNQLVEFFLEEYPLPPINSNVRSTQELETLTYDQISRRGVSARKSRRGTLKRALMRSIASGEYDYNNPRIHIHGDDSRYHSPTMITKPKMNGIAIHLVDSPVLSNMKSKELEDPPLDYVNLISFWVDALLGNHFSSFRSYYMAVDGSRVYHPGIMDYAFATDYFEGSQRSRVFDFPAFEHNSNPHEAYKYLKKEIFDQLFRLEDHNVYLFHYSSGVHMGSFDHALDTLKHDIFPHVNQYSYLHLDADEKEFEFKTALREFRAKKCDPSMQRRIVIPNLVKSLDDIIGALQTIFRGGN